MSKDNLTMEQAIAEMKKKGIVFVDDKKVADDIRWLREKGYAKR